MDGERIGEFVRLLLKWNVRINLTGARSAEDVVGEHLIDSFAMAGFVPEGARVVDVGSGGGLPAIPLAILRPECFVTMVEPRGKRVAFLRTAVRELGCGHSEVVHGRVDSIPRHVYGVAGSRATFEVSQWLEVARDLVVRDGRIVAFASSAVPAVSGLALSASVSYLTSGGGRRWAGAYVPRGT